METVEEVLEKVKKCLESKPEVLAGYFYGSRARGESVKSSDIDIGVLLYPDFDYNLYYMGGLYNDLQRIMWVSPMTNLCQMKRKFLEYLVAKK